MLLKKQFQRWFQTLLIIIYLVQPASVLANDESKVKAAFIEKLTRFIDWPDKPAGFQHQSFTLCVIGGDTLDGALDQLAKITTVKNKRLEVLYLQNIEDINGCDSIFISTSMSKHLTAVLERVKTHPVLTFGDTEGYAARGVMINFFRHEGRLRFEINPQATRAAGIRVGSRVLKLARIVDEEA